MRITSESLLDLLYNRKLPQIYRDEDSKIGFPLKRYLESLILGGYSEAISDIEGLIKVLDLNESSESLFPYLYESFGLEYFPDIDPKYQRKFILNLGELVRRRGTFSCVHYLIRALTGLESELSLKDNNLEILLLADSVEQIVKMDVSIKVIGNYIRTQIPYYITPVFKSRIDTQVINAKSHSFSAITHVKKYTLNTYKEGR